MRAKSSPAALVDNFSLPLPVTVICELLGVPAKGRHFFQHFSTVMLSTTAATAEEIETANTTLRDYLREHIAEHRKHPADDLLTDLISARDEQDRLSDFIPLGSGGGQTKIATGDLEIGGQAPGPGERGLARPTG
jgi:nocardicin N-oxygenase